MGEEEKKKAEEKKVEDGKKEEDKKEEGKKQEGGEKKAEAGGEKKEEKKKDGEGKKGSDGEGEKKSAGGNGEGEKKETPPPPPPPPPPEEIVMHVYMHCEGCARKVKRSLKGFEGVEDVTTDCRTQKVVVKGKVAAADPLKVVDRVEKKSGRKVKLLTPIPPKPEKEKEEVKEKPKLEEKKEEPPVISVVLKVHMHCEACSQEIKKRILKMKGVQSVDPDLKSSQVTVKGVFEPPKLVEYVYKRTGRHSVVLKTEPTEKKADDKGKEEGKGEKKADDGGGEKDKDGGGGGVGKEGQSGGEGEKEGGGEGEGKKEGGGSAAVDEAVAAAMAATAAKFGEVTMNSFYHHYPRHQVEYVNQLQIFSDENPNACSVM